MRQWLFVLMLIVLAVRGGAAQPAPPRDTDLDRFMAAVLARRDDNWKKLQQYILDERERVQVVGPGGVRLFGMQHDYRWFVRDGFFIRSPLAANGVTIGESERRRYEARWLGNQQARDKKKQERDRESGEPPAAADAVPVEALGDVLRQQSEPSFVSAAYFLRFRFEPGRYALVGKDSVDGREVLKIEYYPARLFDDDADHKSRTERRTEQATRRDRGDLDEERVERQMNKVSLVTLWILREQRQIVRYVFDNVDLGFLPGHSVLRVEDLTASMTMSEPFPGIWLPKAVDARLAAALAVGLVEARYDIRYADYREAGVTVRVR